ncbi:MAG: zinc ribbon domain-containing protein [Pseudomonadota bacterium]|nr:zinc ribbon domain-containing protein [Pseudomonadota bacterium]
MPIYEYQCASCGTVFDNLQKISDPDPGECPKCDLPQISRRVTAPSFRLAGSGWYETDFKKDGDKKRNLSGDASSGAPAPEAATPAATTKTESPTTAPAPAPSTKSDSV